MSGTAETLDNITKEDLCVCGDLCMLPTRLRSIMHSGGIKNTDALRVLSARDLRCIRGMGPQSFLTMMEFCRIKGIEMKQKPNCGFEPNETSVAFSEWDQKEVSK